jgi:hypothetical protein
MSMIFGFFLQRSITIAVAERYLGEVATLGSAYSAASRHFWTALGYSLLVAIACGLLLIVFPVAIWLGVRWSLGLQAIMLEDKGVMSSMSRSTNLVKGSWWRVLGTLFVGVLFQSVVAALPVILLSVILGVIVGVTIGVTGAAAGMASAMLAVTVITLVVTTVFSILSAPLSPSITTLLYYDLRIRKEGFDLELLNQSME